ncbi:MAG: PAS domain S-box protein [Deltaproteobacteria bacterium]|nr:MAG: PAS domain S-box protein [Deltaproteobacteria bacterium]
MEHTEHPLRKQIIIPLMFCLFIMLAASIASVIMIQRLHIINAIKSNVNGVEQLFPTLLEMESTQLDSQLNILKRNERLQKSWLAGDKKLLYQEAFTFFSEINSKYNITHFYFIDLDQAAFLRVHSPERFGDYINRATLNTAVRKGKPSSGIELGPLGTFTLRVVHPWFIDGVLTGYVELGKEILHIAPMIKETLDVDLIFTIDKTRLSRSDWEKGMHMLGRSANWDSLTNSVIIDATIEEIPLPVDNLLFLPHQEHAEDILEFSAGNLKLRAMFVPLIDAAARHVGDIIVISDVTDLIYSLGMITISILTLFLFIGGILFTFMYFYLVRTEVTITSIQNRLIDEIEEHKLTEKDLKHHRNNLELLVQERTFKLNNSLANLKSEVEDRKLAEEALRLSEDQFRGVFEGSALGITISDTEGHILKCNPAYQKMLGYSEEELQNLNFSALTHSEDVQKHVSLYYELLHGKRDFFSAEKRYVSKDGHIVWGQLTVSLIRDQDGKPLFVIGLIENIGEKKQLEIERIKASKLESIGVLAGGIAHDFNNLLTAIIGNIALAKNYIEPANKASLRLQQAEKALLRSKELTQQLLTFSRGGDPVKKTVPIADAIHESTSFALRGANVKCKFDIAANLWRTLVDIGQFSQVIQNLVLNADNAMPQGGTITISAQNFTLASENELPIKAGKYVKISIQDQGQGIPQEDLPKIFDPYFTTKKDGSGLGLSIVHSIVRNHDGHIEVDSQPGKGTLFHLYLPASLKKGSAEKAEPSEVVKGSGKILLMDDEEMIRDFAKELLEYLGYDVEVARDGAEAVTLYQSADVNGIPFDAVFMDITVPGGMGGKEAIKEMLAIDPDVKAIVSSGYARDPIMSNYKQYGFVGVVPKPYNLEDMSKELHRVLSQ